MIHVFCTRKSDGARALAKLLGGKKVKQIDNTASLVVNWGSLYPAHAFAKALNGAVFHNKFKELQQLSSAGIPVPKHSKGLPGQAGWMARKNKHQEANDLLAALPFGDYYVKLEPIEEEYRVHSFRNKTLRLGKKVPRVVSPHPVFRSWKAGWKLSYAQWNPPDGLRSLAHKAVKALGLDFGAVDIGVKPNGDLVVFEVNTAPGLEGNTINKYADAIKALDS